MKRREFLRTTVLVAGAMSWLGCSNEGGADGSPSFGGRELKPGEKYFPQSVASGDPKEASVILWTRAVDAKAKGALTLMLEVALDEKFEMRVELPEAAASLEAKPEHDGCVRVRVESLDPSTTYYYRFAYVVDDTAYVSRTGRTKTAAASDDDTSVTFAVMSCQDYVGRYYHAFEHMAAQELDFFVHLGDYVYETTGDPSFQSTSSARKLKFTDTKGAIALGAGDKTFYAANSLDNYRELYQTYRSDPKLQRVHELFPMIAVWDDHEFSDDCHGQTATYFDGAKDELEPTRRANADQAWFEFMPVDYGSPTFVYDRKAAAFPEDLTIYRDFTFGKHLHLVMTDLRRYRGDHLVPEDAFPGAVAATEEELTAALGKVPAFATAYVDLDAAEYSAQKAALNAEAEALGFVQGDFTGLVDVAFVNEQIKSLSASPQARQHRRQGQAERHQLQRHVQDQPLQQRGLALRAAHRALRGLRAGALAQEQGRGPADHGRRTGELVLRNHQGFEADLESVGQRVHVHAAPRGPARPAARGRRRSAGAAQPVRRGLGRRARSPAQDPRRRSAAWPTSWP